MAAQPIPLSYDALDALQVLGENIRRARRARGWSQAEASQRFVFSRATLQRIESGDQAVSIGAYLAALDVMGLLNGVSAIGASHTDPQQRRSIAGKVR